MRKLILLGALLLSSAASAQPVDSRIPRDEFAGGFKEDSAAVRQIGARYGDCVVEKQPAAALEFVLAQGTELPARTNRRLFERVGDGNCLLVATSTYDGVQMRFPLDTMRYTLADALFRKSMAASGPIRIDAALAPLVHPAFDEEEYQARVAKGSNKREAEELAKDRSLARVRRFLSEFGECVVRAEPAGSYALLQSKVLTPEENKAFAALVPSFGKCIDQGQDLALNKAILRGTIALGYVRLAKASASAPVSAPAR